MLIYLKYLVQQNNKAAAGKAKGYNRLNTFCNLNEEDIYIWPFTTAIQGLVSYPMSEYDRQDEYRYGKSPLPSYTSRHSNFFILPFASLEILHIVLFYS